MTCRQASPQDGNGVLPEDRIRGQDGEVFDPGLGDQHPVERIAVGSGQGARRQGMLHGDRKGFEPGFPQKPGKILDGDSPSSEAGEMKSFKNVPTLFLTR